LPSTTSQPSGSENNSLKPERIDATRFFTGGLRCEVPIRVVAPATMASICPRLTFEGPHPNRPSEGRIEDGSLISEGSTAEWSLRGGTGQGCQNRGRQAAAVLAAWAP
jgi:hypothetical protein